MAHVLIADDILISRETLSRVLRDAGHRVSSAQSGAEAVDRARQEQPDLVILDLNMPRMTGLQAAALIKSEAPAFLPVIIMSGQLLSQADWAPILGVVDDYIRKPYVPAELSARIDVWLRVQRMTQDLRRSASGAPRELDRGGSPGGASREADRVGSPGGAAREADRAGSSGGASRSAMSPIPPTALGGDRLRTRIALLDRIQAEWRRALRWNEPFALVLCGAAPATPLPDELMEPLMALGHKSLRQIDSIGTIEPGRIAVLLPNTPPAGALRAAERLRDELRQGNPPSPLGLGVALVPGRDISGPEDLLRAAELAVERACTEGPWRLCLHQHQGYLVRAD